MIVHKSKENNLKLMLHSTYTLILQSHMEMCLTIRIRQLYCLIALTQTSQVNIDSIIEVYCRDRVCNNLKFQSIFQFLTFYLEKNCDSLRNVGKEGHEIRIGQTRQVENSGWESLGYRSVIGIRSEINGRNRNIIMFCKYIIRTSKY